MPKLLIVFGTRPEAIKMCPVVREAKKVFGDENVFVCVTGQHDDLLLQVLDSFHIEPNVNLAIMREKQNLTDITNKVLNGVVELIQKFMPDVVLVHGDTTTAFAAALAAFYCGVPVGHVEAGLRTGDPLSPFPEEFNRVAIDEIAHYCFAPTKSAAENLLAMQKRDQVVAVTGNTVIDALKATVPPAFHSWHLDWANGRRIVLLTAHRRENQGTKMEKIFLAIRRIADEENVAIIYPVHPNPEVKMIAHKILQHPNILLIDPLNPLDFHGIMSRAYLVLTDSGGIQEEAPFFGVPVVVLRDTTERPEGVEAGTLVLGGTDEANVYETVKRLLNDKKAYLAMANAVNPYGDGHAAERIVQILAKCLNGKINV